VKFKSKDHKKRQNSKNKIPFSKEESDYERNGSVSHDERGKILSLAEAK